MTDMFQYLTILIKILDLEHIYSNKRSLKSKYGKTKNFVNRKYNLIFNNYKEKEFDKNQITNLSDDLSFLSKN